MHVWIRSKASKHLTTLIQTSILFLTVWIIHQAGLIDAELGASKFVSNGVPHGVHYPNGVSLYFILPTMDSTDLGGKKLSNVMAYVAVLAVLAASAAKFVSCQFNNSLLPSLVAMIVPLYANDVLDYSIGVRKNVGLSNPYGDYFPAGLTLFFTVPESDTKRFGLGVILGFIIFTIWPKLLLIPEASPNKRLLLCVVLCSFAYLSAFQQIRDISAHVRVQARDWIEVWKKWNKILDSSGNRLCIAPSLRPHQMHLVVATGDSKNSLFEVEWLKQLGTSNASAFIYRRITAGQGNITGVLKGSSKLKWPCGLSLEERLLAPNRGQEAAAYLAHIVEFYDDLPEAILFTHGHGPTSWHTNKPTFIRRARAYYRGVVAQRTTKSKVEEDSELMHKHKTYTTRLQVQELYREMARHVAEEHALRHLKQFSKYHVSLSTGNQEGLCSGAYKDQIPQNETPHSRRLLDWTEISPYSMPPQDTEHPTYSVFQEIYDRLGNRSHASRNTRLWSCCATFMVRPWHIRRHPKLLYSELLHALLERDLPSYFSSRWFEFNWYNLLSGAELPDDYCRLLEGIDQRALNIVS
jgi:hypothetical protein